MNGGQQQKHGNQMKCIRRKKSAECVGTGTNINQQKKNRTSIIIIDVKPKRGGEKI